MARATVIIGLGLIAFDRWLKILSFERQGIDGPYFTYFENDRLFGIINLDNGLHLALSVAVFLAVLCLMIFAVRRAVPRLINGCFLILLGGGSNLIDRLFSGSVIDYIQVSSVFPTFNIADGLIFFGVCLVSLFPIHPIKRSEVDRQVLSK